MKILFLTTILLSKSCNGGEVASQCFIDALEHLGNKVTVLGYLRKGDSITDRSGTVIVDQRYTETRKSKYHAIAWYLLSLLRNIPYSSAKYISQPYVHSTNVELQKNDYDLVIIDHAQMGWILKEIPDDIPLFFIAHNVEQKIYQEIFSRSSNFLSRWIYKREAKLVGSLESQLTSRAKQIWVLTQSDKHAFSKLADGAKVKVLNIPPNSSSSTQLLHSQKKFDIGLLGSWAWSANVEALNWFLEHVYPSLPTNLSIHIAGKGADWVVEKYPSIVYEGVVPDAQQFLAHARVVAIPTLSGGGIQIKTLDAIGSGSLIVATPIALRGIDSPPSTVTVAQQPQEFSRQLKEAIQHSGKNNAMDAKEWYRQRKKQFQQDISNTIIQFQK